MQKKKSYTAMLAKKASKLEWLRLQLWITKKQWLTKMQESLLFVFVVELFYWAINLSIISSLLIMLIRSVSRSSSLQSFYQLGYSVDINTKACFIELFVFFGPTNGFLFHSNHSTTTQFNSKIGFHLIFEQ